MCACPQHHFGLVLNFVEDIQLMAEYYAPSSLGTFELTNNCASAEQSKQRLGSIRACDHDAEFERVRELAWHFIALPFPAYQARRTGSPATTPLRKLRIPKNGRRWLPRQLPLNNGLDPEQVAWGQGRVGACPPINTLRLVRMCLRL